MSQGTTPDFIPADEGASDGSAVGQPPAPQNAFDNDLPQNNPTDADWTGNPTPGTNPVDNQQPDELVGRGILFSLISIPVGLALTSAIWVAGFISSLTSLAAAVLAVWLYSKGAGTSPKRGIVPLILVIVIGVVFGIFGMVFTDGIMAYTTEVPGSSFTEGFAWTAAFIAAEPEVLGEYGRDIAMYVLFAALGTGGTLMSLARSRRF